MGCGCGGSKRDAPAAAGAPASGPGSEGYYWSGPKRPSSNGPPPKQAAAPEKT